MLIGIERDIPIQVYNVALAVRRWALRKNGGDADGMCSDSSCEICRRLAGTRYRPMQYDGNFICNNKRGYYGDGDQFLAGHCWVQFGHIILDVTADQFNKDLHGIKMKPIVYGTRTQLMRLYKGESLY